MIVKLKWSKALSVGNPEIDKQHRELFSIVNDLIKVHNQGSKHDEVNRVLLAIVRYAEKHFITEDEYMATYDYPKFADHRQEHSDYLSHVNQFLDSHEKGSADLTKGMLKFLSKWWVDHVSKSDMEYGVWARSRKDD